MASTTKQRRYTEILRYRRRSFKSRYQQLDQVRFHTVGHPREMSRTCSYPINRFSYAARSDRPSQTFAKSKIRFAHWTTWVLDIQGRSPRSVSSFLGYRRSLIKSDVPVGPERMEADGRTAVSKKTGLRRRSEFVTVTLSVCSA